MVTLKAEKSGRRLCCFERRFSYYLAYQLGTSNDLMSGYHLKIFFDCTFLGFLKSIHQNGITDPWKPATLIQNEI